MGIPDYQAFMLPLLQYASDGQTRKTRDAYDVMAELFELSDDDREALLPSGNQPVLNNRVGWALTYLRQAGLIESPARGSFRISDEGHKFLAEEPASLDVEQLKAFPAFREFLNRRSTRRRDNDSSPEIETIPSEVVDTEGNETPDEQLISAWQRLQRNLQADVLERIKSSSPRFFEFLVVDVLVAMGYGGNRIDAGQALGRSGDEGIDGLIKEDPLGLEVIYLQAKRWEGVVGRPEIQKFAGALQGQRARKGVFITTSGFTREAAEYAENIETRIILIDGNQLAELMVQHGVGVSLADTFPVKKIDTDYFTED